MITHLHFTSLIATVTALAIVLVLAGCDRSGPTGGGQAGGAAAASAAAQSGAAVAAPATAASDRPQRAQVSSRCSAHEPSS